MVAPGSNEMSYAVHTRTCTYLLDEEGVCRWVVSPQGLVPSHVLQCIGAQFVASLDTTIEGGLVTQLAVGARALFVRYSGDRMMLLRTGPIEGVDDRRQDAPPSTSPSQPPAAAVHGAVEQYGKRHGVPTPDTPWPSFGIEERWGDEQTITVKTAVPGLPRTERLPNDLDPGREPG